MVHGHFRMFNKSDESLPISIQTFERFATGLRKVFVFELLICIRLSLFISPVSRRLLIFSSTATYMKNGPISLLIANLIFPSKSGITSLFLKRQLWLCLIEQSLSKAFQTYKTISLCAGKAKSLSRTERTSLART